MERERRGVARADRLASAVRGRQALRQPRRTTPEGRVPSTKTPAALRNPRRRREDPMDRQGEGTRVALRKQRG